MKYIQNNLYMGQIGSNVGKFVMGQRLFSSPLLRMVSKIQVYKEHMKN